MADAVSPPRYQHFQWQTLSESDITTFLDAAKKTPRYYLFYVLLFTGLRRGEVLALRWRDLDLLLYQAHVTHALKHLRTGQNVIGPTKSAKGRRMVSLTPSTGRLLQECKDKQEKERSALCLPSKEDDLVFADIQGEPLLPDTVTHVWIKLVRRSGFKGIRLQDARHTHASLMLKQGVHPKIVQERLGHASIQVTLDTYSHVVPGLQEGAAAGFDKMVLPKREKESIENN